MVVVVIAVSIVVKGCANQEINKNMTKMKMLKMRTK